MSLPLLLLPCGRLPVAIDATPPRDAVGPLAVVDVNRVPAPNTVAAGVDGGLALGEALGDRPIQEVAYAGA